MKNCKPSQRRLPRTFELKDELIVEGITQHSMDDTPIVEPGTTMRLHFKQEILGALPQEDVSWNFQTCAVVGNGGSTLGKGKGMDIDDHDAVIRTNYAPTEGFEDDVGSRTTFDFINLQHTKPFVVGRTRTGGNLPEAARSTLRNSTITLFEVTNPTARYHLYAPLLKRFKPPSPHGKGGGDTSGTRVTVLSPELVAHGYKLWASFMKAAELSTTRAGYKPANYHGKPMSGWFAVVFAMQICKEVDLYGFSPYDRRARIRGERYHYFDDIVGIVAHHSFDFAYEAFRQISYWPCGNSSVVLQA